MSPLTNMECVTLIVVAMLCVIPCAIQAWLSARTQTRMALENRTLIAALLGMSDRPGAVILGRQIESTSETQIKADAERQGHPVPNRRPMMGQT